MFDTVLIAGLGLMGGSMAKTIKARTLSRVLGWNRTRATAEQALADGSIDAIATEALYKEADLVIIGLYPQATVDWLLENMPKMKKGCVIVDMVGVKQFMVNHLEQAALDAGVHYVGGHPMAGREFSGLDYSLPTLFDGASMIFVPTKSGTERVLERGGVLHVARLLNRALYRAAARSMIAFTSQLALWFSSAYIKSPGQTSTATTRRAAEIGACCQTE